MDRFIVRMPEGMRDRIKAAADRNGRSMNAEILQTLEERYPGPRSLDEIIDRIRWYRHDLESLRPGPTNVVPTAKLLQQELDQLEKALEQHRKALQADE